MKLSTQSLLSDLMSNKSATKNLKFTIWDIGGQTKLRNMWHYYYEGGDAIIYVLDSSDNERIQLAKETLDSVMNH